MSVNFPRALFSLLDVLTHAAEIDRLSQTVGAELPLYATVYLRKAHTSHDLAMQALAWYGMVWFSAVQLGTSYANLRQPHIFKCKI